MNTIQEGWEAYKEMVLDTESMDARTLDNIRYTFYSGALHLFQMSIDISQNYSDEVGASIVEGLANEANAFIDEMEGEAIE